MLRPLLRGLKYLTFGSVIGGSLVILQRNDWNISSIGAVRFGRAAFTAVAVVADYKRSLSGQDETTGEYKELVSQVHLRSALKLREMCCANGGSFIKVGQHLGALDYLLPKEYVDTMKVLHSDAPQSPVEQLYKVIEEDIGKVNELFSSFSPCPQGTASLAQVHKATLHDGTTVAVKVQHPRVKAHSVVDIATMEFLTRVVGWIFPEFQFMWLAEETKKNLPIELDFVQEGKNCERVAKMLSHFVFLEVPKVHWDLTSERVLTMEFCEGGQVNDKQYMEENNIDVNEVSWNLGKLYSEMIFVHGYIHCDPHPGNVLVRKSEEGTKLVLLDHGLYVSLTDDFRLNYCKLWQSILDTNLQKIKKYAQRMGTGELYPLYTCMVAARSWSSLTKGIDKQKITKEEDNEIRQNVVSYLPEISSILNRVPRQMLLIFKTNDLLRGIESTLKTRANAQSFIPMSKCCVKSLYKHKRKHCHTTVGRLRLIMLENWSLFKISLFELYLWIKSSKMFATRKMIDIRNTL